MVHEESAIDQFDMEASPAFGMLPDAGEFVVKDFDIIFEEENWDV